MEDGMEEVVVVTALVDDVFVVVSKAEDDVEGVSDVDDVVVTGVGREWW